MAVALMAVAQDETQYTNGYFTINEGQYGNEPGMLNFYSNETGEMQTKVYQAASGNTLGMTAEFGTLADGKLFICSKQHYSTTGGRLVVADAKTLKTLASYKEIDGNADTRGVCAVPAANRFFVGSTSGVYAYDLKSLEQIGVVTGTAMEGGAYSAGSGDMVAQGNYLYVSTQDGVQVIDAVANSLLTTLELANTVSVFKLGEQIYAAVNSYSGWGGTPGETDTEQFVPITGTTLGTPVNVPMASPSNWFAPKPCAPVAMKDGKSVVYCAGENTDYICKYDFSTGTFTKEFIKFDSPQKMYGHVVNVDPTTGDVLACTFQSYGSTNYWFNIYDSTNGTVKKSVKMPGHYWFPSQIIKAEDKETATGINGLAVSASEVANVTYCNLAGQTSTVPFDGVNIVVTRYTDGTMTSNKVIF